MRPKLTYHIQYIRATQGSVSSSFLVPSTVIVVAHHVNEIQVYSKTFHVISDIYGVFASTKSCSQHEVMFSESGLKLFDQQEKV